MPRKTTKSLIRKVSPDRKYQSVLVQRLINKSMLNGKKQVAERAVYTDDYFGRGHSTKRGAHTSNVHTKNRKAKRRLNKKHNK